MKNTKQALINHCQAYPDVQIRDIFKFLFQGALGCEHLVSSQDTVTEFIRREYADKAESSVFVDALDGEYSRVHLSWIDRGLSAETLGRIFFLSAKPEPEGKEALIQKLKIAKLLVADGLLPFSSEEFETAVQKWKEEGYGAVHHSDVFRARYRPAYRVVSNRYVPYIPLFAQLDKMLESGRVVMAVEGGCASGKSTLGEILREVYGCTLFHTDDFFLQPFQRTKERLSEAGGNLDRERLKSEVLIPLSKGKAVDYRRFDCCTMSIMPPERIEPGRLTVVEGAYSMHPDLRGYYDFSVFLDLPEEVRRERIIGRNSPDMAQRFFNEWMPMENRYFSDMRIKEMCNLKIDGNI